MPVFSIVIVNYNHGAFLEQAIRSVINQSCRDFELIVVDGLSTDNSIEIVHKYDAHLAWWVSEPDSGQSEALNKGFSKAKGSFFLWLNADDIILPGTLDAALRYVRRYTDCLWLTGNTVYYDDKGVIRRCLYGPRWNSWLMERTFLCNMVNGPSSIFHNSLFKKVGGIDLGLHYAMDLDLWIKFSDLGIRFHRINHYIWGFRIHKGSRTSHSIGGVQSHNFRRERDSVLSQHKRVRTKSELFLLRTYKISTGAYLHTIYDTWQWQGKKIADYVKVHLSKN